MNTTFILFGFATAVLMGAALVSLLTTVKPEWSMRRRQLIAASILPAITVIAALLGILAVAMSEHGQSERMERLAIAAIATIGGGLALLAFVGGLVGALLAGRKRRG
jgi:hypothetical protein